MLIVRGWGVSTAHNPECYVKLPGLFTRGDCVMIAWVRLLHNSCM